MKDKSSSSSKELAILILEILFIPLLIFLILYPIAYSPSEFIWSIQHNKLLNYYLTTISDALKFLKSGHLPLVAIPIFVTYLTYSIISLIMFLLKARFFIRLIVSTIATILLAVIVFILLALIAFLIYGLSG
ncbi:MAG: hypothetical protein DRO65_03615 [Candidatus Altiarchaeales archaeon]|nr:MAG: hypothetical protein DRO65_03615 [Candidatus Altiarchaeales archaeon]